MFDNWHLYYHNNEIHTGLYMNVYNTHTIELLKKYKVKIICLSPELKEADLKEFKTNNNLSYLTYGRLELMLIKNNIFKYNSCILSGDGFNIT